jgi:hypothetical protein
MQDENINLDVDNIEIPKYVYLGGFVAIAMIITFIRTFLFEVALSDKFNKNENNTVNPNIVTLTFGNKISIKVITLLLTMIVIFMLKKTLLANFLKE